MLCAPPPPSSGWNCPRSRTLRCHSGLQDGWISSSDGTATSSTLSMVRRAPWILLLCLKELEQLHDTLSPYADSNILQHGRNGIVPEDSSGQDASNSSNGWEQSIHGKNHGKILLQCIWDRQAGLSASLAWLLSPDALLLPAHPWEDLDMAWCQ